VSATVGQDDACAQLGVDAWGLERLLAAGELKAEGEPGARTLDAAALATYAAQRARRRAEALEALARLDGPHLGGR